MPKFKIGDIVRVVSINETSGEWLPASCGKTGIVQEVDDCPWVLFTNGEEDWGPEEYLQLVSEETPPNPSHIEINGKRYRLVEEA